MITKFYLKSIKASFVSYILMIPYVLFELISAFFYYAAVLFKFLSKQYINLLLK